MTLSVFHKRHKLTNTTVFSGQEDSLKYKMSVSTSTVV